METFKNFDRFFAFLDNGIVTKYFELDDTGRCYFSVEHCIPFVNRSHNGNSSINLRDGQTGKMLHTIYKENDFDYGTIESVPPHLKITINSRSGYKYIMYFKKFS